MPVCLPVCVWVGGGGRGSITFPKVDLQTEMTRASSRHNQVAPENNNEEGAVDRDGPFISGLLRRRATADKSRRNLGELLRWPVAVQAELHTARRAHRQQ